MEPTEITITNKTNEQFEAFDGELMHPALDMKNGILTVSFRYRVSPQEEKELFVVVDKGSVEIIYDDHFQAGNKHYYFEKRKRMLMRIEEKWSAHELHSFIQDYTALKVTVNPHEIFEEVVSLAKKYIELEQEIDYYLLAAWILGTYFYPLFYSFPFLHIKAPKRSGKSQCLNLLTQLCFNAVKARPSLAALSDTVDSLRGTYLIDQADSLERKGNEELLDILADSYKISGGKRRIVNLDKRRGRETLEFETYSPKAFASIRELPEDLRDRCLAMPLIRSQKNFPDPDDNNQNWRDARGNIYKAQLTNYSLINSTYCVRKAEYRQSQEILGRSLELWLPFEVILECFGVQDRIGEAKKRFLSQYGYSEYEPSEVEEATIKTILSQLTELLEVVLTPKEISELINPEIFPPGDTPKQRAAKVGWAIKKFNLSSEKKPRTKDGVRYLFQKGKVEDIYQSYFKMYIEPTPPTLPEENNIDVEQIAM